MRGMRGVDIDFLRGPRAFERRESEYGRRDSDYVRRQLEREERLEREYEQRRQAEKKRGNAPAGGTAAKDNPSPPREVTAHLLTCGRATL